jgi:copper homeostasis protein (lipoprotein)
MKKILLVAGVSLLLLSACSMGQATQPSPSATASTQASLGTFVGTLPCADCSGITTELTLYQDPTTSAATTYVLKQTYQGRDPNPVVTNGNWDVSRGTPTDANATVYVLNPDQSKDQQTYYLKVGDTQLVQLDANQNLINAPGMSFTLTKQE